MTALPKFPLDAVEVPRGKTMPHQKTNLRGVQPSSSTLFPTPSSPVKVRQLPKTAKQPAWLNFLVKLERGTSLATWGLGVAALCAYGLAVMSQQTWYEEYSRLQSLQRQERQLKATNAAFKHQMAKQAEKPEANLTPQVPENSIFLRPEPEAARQPVAAPVPAPASTDVTPAHPSETPLGY